MEPVEEGRIEYPNGDEFEGETLDGMPVRGKFQFKSELSHRAKHKGDVYEGSSRTGPSTERGSTTTSQRTTSLPETGTRVTSRAAIATERGPTTTRTGT